MGIVAITLIIIVLVVFFYNLRIVSQSDAYVLERLGSYLCNWEQGLHFKIPLLDRIAAKVSLKEHVVDFAPQPVITKDNVTMQIDTVVFYQITDPKLFVYGVSNPRAALENLCATTLRNIIGQLELDDTLSSRDIINARMRSILDEATDPWGIKVNRVEVKNILPPQDIQNAMEKQMRAERERREQILRAEGQKTAAILEAEGHNKSMILEAEADKTAKIYRAEGEAEALLRVQEATAKTIELIKQAAPDQGYLALKSLEAIGALANGQATKIVVPADMKDLASWAVSLKELSSGK
ncbi:SPFH/Band 7/PHB domain protein [Candidatus Haliotispira prima]|uniref:Protein QmcA n=1 Tax=Candidatus Haliotispira prima TaxID=3034016 RepID=A0ABY8MII2_9SPIO|nr:SPFH/Band 7/PHB domain protein [Candidatus Haliotispira prima]